MSRIWCPALMISPDFNKSLIGLRYITIESLGWDIELPSTDSLEHLRIIFTKDSRPDSSLNLDCSLTPNLNTLSVENLSLRSRPRGEILFLDQTRLQKLRLVCCCYSSQLLRSLPSSLRSFGLDDCQHTPEDQGDRFPAKPNKLPRLELVNMSEETKKFVLRYICAEDIEAPISGRTN